MLQRVLFCNTGSVCWSWEWNPLRSAAAIVYNRNRVEAVGATSRCESGMWPQIQGAAVSHGW